jgi:O-acetyl-ADP-ribose deacetylase (regulator of RNase III)
MSVEIVSGDIFKADVEVITDANNSIGVSGAGLAGVFARRYPTLASVYNNVQRMNQSKSPALLYPYIFAKGDLDNWDYAVCKFPTMIYPGSVTKEEDIERNLRSLKNTLIDVPYFSQSLKTTTFYKSIALPALGCGIGRYSFKKLTEQVKEIFDNDPSFNCRVLLYGPTG